MFTGVGPSLSAPSRLPLGSPCSMSDTSLSLPSIAQLDGGIVCREAIPAAAAAIRPRRNLGSAARILCETNTNVVPTIWRILLSMFMYRLRRSEQT